MKHIYKTCNVNKIFLISFLRDLRYTHKNIKAMPMRGICSELTQYFNIAFTSVNSMSNVNIKHVFEETMLKVCEDWEHFSGCECYPISHPDYDHLPKNTKIIVIDGVIEIYNEEKHTQNTNNYYEASNIGDIYYSTANMGYDVTAELAKNTKDKNLMYEGEYGRRRLELVQLMIKELQDSLETSDKSTMPRDYILAPLYNLKMLMMYSSTGGICRTMVEFITNGVVCDGGLLETRRYKNKLEKIFRSAMVAACVDWEHYSGDSSYPILHPNYEHLDNISNFIEIDGKFEVYNSDIHNMHIHNIYHNFSHYGYVNSSKKQNMYGGEYGRRRLELVQRMIDIIESDYENE